VQDTFAADNALETGLPFEQLNSLAVLESWRKEINRPIYHTHKWWATRLGSVFRAIVLAGLSEPETDVWTEFYRKHAFRDRIVLDPFMGSGTTVGEALKLGCRAVGVDINPVACFQVRKALGGCGETALREAYRRLEAAVAPRIRALYRSTYKGEEAEILYVFWVKVVSCPSCAGRTRLFDKWIFSSDAYPRLKPESRAVCPACGEINSVLYTDTDAACPSCSARYNPQDGPATRQRFKCEGCGDQHRIIDVVRASGRVPDHEMYAIMLLLPDGSKVYKRPDESDRQLMQRARELFDRSEVPYPRDEIASGHNTDQARGYNYRHWHQMFNERQLYSLGLLLSAILQEPDRNARECLLLLFSGMLEFNNMFCSFKGEGTGAVRHLFSHHILKPERAPLEANPWGTKKSSGSFSTLFDRRLLAAKRYCDSPFELRATPGKKRKSEKVHGLSEPLRPIMAKDFAEVSSAAADALLVTGDARALPIPDNSVDLIVTDPPYFDNVHYSELADFFYCWLKLGLLDDPAFQAESSRSPSEVQGQDVEDFGNLLGEVFRDCARVLKQGGTMAFTFHHARDEAWVALSRALEGAGFAVMATHPIKAEMSGAVPKTQAKEPITLDLVVVCRHFGCRPAQPPPPPADVIRRYNASGVRLTKGDVRVILMGGFLRSREPVARLAKEIDELFAGQSVR